MTALAAYALFDTAFGTAGIAWGPRGIVGVQLPEADAQATRERLLRYTGQLSEAPPPPEVRAAIGQIIALLAGEPHDTSAIVLDMSTLTDFQRRVYALACAIPAGQTRTYGELAADLGDKHLARAVGQALGLNPFAPVVPCHRILAAGQRPGGFSAYGGAETKRRMLAAEGAALGDANERLF